MHTAGIRRVGVVLAGVGGVSEAFIHVLEQRFCNSQVRVHLVAIGDSKGYVCAAATSTHFAWSDVAAIVAHKKSGCAIREWIPLAYDSHVVLEGLGHVMRHLDGRRELDDYVVVDCP